MKISILNKSSSEIDFLIEDVKPDFAGMLRRVMISEIPTMAIEWVDFKKNSSALVDEIIANRLGQMPLTYDRKAYNLPSECRCKGKGCSRCQVKLSLKKSGPCVIYSGDLKSTDKSVKAVYDNIPIVELFEDQELQFSAIAQLGLGKAHAKWQCAVVGYKNLPKITVSAKDKSFDKYVKACPRNVFKIQGDKLVVTDPIKCNLCMQCVDAGSGVRVEPIENSFVFHVETASGLKPGDILTMASGVLEKKLKDFGKELKKLKLD